MVCWNKHERDSKGTRYMLYIRPINAEHVSINPCLVYLTRLIKLHRDISRDTSTSSNIVLFRLLYVHVRVFSAIKRKKTLDIIKDSCEL